MPPHRPLLQRVSLRLLGLGAAAMVTIILLLAPLEGHHQHRQELRQRTAAGTVPPGATAEAALAQLGGAKASGTGWWAAALGKLEEQEERVRVWREHQRSIVYQVRQACWYRRMYFVLWLVCGHCSPSQMLLKTS